MSDEEAVGDGRWKSTSGNSGCGNASPGFEMSRLERETADERDRREGLAKNWTAWPRRRPPRPPRADELEHQGGRVGRRARQHPGAARLSAETALADREEQLRLLAAARDAAEADRQRLAGELAAVSTERDRAQARVDDLDATRRAAVENAEQAVREAAQARSAAALASQQAAAERERREQAETRRAGRSRPPRNGWASNSGGPKTRSPLRPAPKPSSDALRGPARRRPAGPRHRPHQPARTPKRHGAAPRTGPPTPTASPPSRHPGAGHRHRPAPEALRRAEAAEDRLAAPHQRLVAEQETAASEPANRRSHTGARQANDGHRRPRGREPRCQPPGAGPAYPGRIVTTWQEFAALPDKESGKNWGRLRGKGLGGWVWVKPGCQRRKSSARSSLSTRVRT